jgi:hypothetical protein
MLSASSQESIPYRSIDFTLITRCEFYRVLLSLMESLSETDKIAVCEIMFQLTIESLKSGTLREFPLENRLRGLLEEESQMV